MNGVTPTCGESLKASLAPAVEIACPSAAGSPSSSHRCFCWCCDSPVDLLVPNADLGPPSTPHTFSFKCGWCGALTLSEADEATGRRLSRGTFRSLMKFLSSWRWRLSLAVVAFILSIVVPGAFIVLPYTHGSLAWLHQLNHVITWTLTANILLNFSAAACMSPGTTMAEPEPEPRTAPMSVATDGSVTPKVHQGSRDNYRFCGSCRRAKSPTTHHCNVCRTCITDLDHHCPFINNCVGTRNTRNYLLFLGWVLLAMPFCVLQAGILYAVQSEELRSSVLDSFSRHGASWRLPFLLWLSVFNLPTPLQVATHMMVSSIVVEAACGYLFLNTLRTVSCRPHTDLGFKDRRLQDVMGGAGLLPWLLPYWGTPHLAGKAAKLQ